MRLAVLAGLAVVVVLVAWVAGTEAGGPSATRSPGSVRLGPDPGQPVAEYRAGLARQLPPPGEPVLALVQPVAQLDVRAAAALAGPSPVVTGVFRVPLPRVQTALRFASLAPGAPLPAALDGGRARAEFAAGGDASRRTGRPADVAAVEAAALADPGCRCVLALVVRADRAGLDALAGRPGVRAVHAAPPGVVPVELALAPLLPVQVQRADPVPDDGVLPPA